MPQDTPFPQSFEAYCKEHPEKFETRIAQKKRLLYGTGAILLALIACFPGILAHVPILALLPGWMIMLGAGAGALYCLVVAFVDCDDLYNTQSNGTIKQIGLKKFDRVNTKPDQIAAALERRDFDMLSDAAETYNDPLQLYVYEDASGKEFYLHLRAYSTPSEFCGASDVVIVSGREYDQFRGTIKSISPVKNK